MPDEMQIFFPLCTAAQWAYLSARLCKRVAIISQQTMSLVEAGLLYPKSAPCMSKTLTLEQASCLHGDTRTQSNAHMSTLVCKRCGLRTHVKNAPPIGSETPWTPQGRQAMRMLLTTRPLPLLQICTRKRLRPITHRLPQDSWEEVECGEGGFQQWQQSIRALVREEMRAYQDV